MKYSVILIKPDVLQINTITQTEENAHQALSYGCKDFFMNYLFVDFPCGKYDLLINISSNFKICFIKKYNSFLKS